MSNEEFKKDDEQALNKFGEGRVFTHDNPCNCGFPVSSAEHAEGCGYRENSGSEELFYTNKMTTGEIDIGEVHPGLDKKDDKKEKPLSEEEQWEEYKRLFLK